MVVIVVVLVATAVAAILAFELQLRRRRAAPLDTERAERWFVAHAPGPLRHALRAADRRIAGGAATAAVFVVLFLAALAVGSILDGIDGHAGIARWDRSAAQWGADHATTGSVRVLDAITQLGSTRWLLLAMATLGIVESRRHRRWAELGYLALVGVGVSLLNNGLKLLVGRDRPDISRLSSFGGSSFPSGHTAAAAACWAAMAFVVVRRSRRRRERAIAAAVAATITIAVAASRVLLGVHWLTDVIAGAVTGWAWFALVTLVFGGRILRFGEPAERVAGVRAAPAPLEASRPAERAWWKVAPMDRRGVGILVATYVALTAVYIGVGELIVRWWDDSMFGDADTAVNRWLERHRTDTLTELGHFGSALSNTETKIVLVLGLLPLMLHLYRRWHDWAFIACSLLLEVAVFGTTATIVGRPRPPVQQLDGAPTNSWPSGHIAASVVFYVGLATVLVWNNRCRSTRIVALCIGIGAPTVVTASRLYLGMHHPTDVVGGVVLGLTSLAVVRHVLRRTAGDALEHPVTHEVPCDPDSSDVGVTHAVAPNRVAAVSASPVAGTTGDVALTSVGGTTDGGRDE